MEPQVNDTVNTSFAGNTPDTIPGTEFLFGSIIPLSREKSDASVYIPITNSQHELYEYDHRAPARNIPDNVLNTDFSFVVLTFSFVLITFLSVFARRFFTDSFLSLSFRGRHAPAPLPASVTITWPPLAMNLFTMLVISLFAVTAAVFTGATGPLPGVKMIKTFVILCAVFAAALSLRHLISIMVASLTGQKKLFREYVSVIFNSWFIAALFCFVFSFLIIFTPQNNPVFLVYACAGIIVFILFLRIIRLLNIFIRTGVPILYYILYLCALEVFPVLIVMKLLGVF